MYMHVWKLISAARMSVVWQSRPLNTGKFRSKAKWKRWVSASLNSPNFFIHFLKTYKNWEQFSCSFRSSPRSKFKLCPCQRLKEGVLLSLEWKEIAICSVGDELDYIKKKLKLYIKNIHNSFLYSVWSCPCVMKNGLTWIL